MLPLGDDIRTKRTSLITLFLIGVNIAVFLLELLEPDLDSFIFRYGLVPAQFSLFSLPSYYRLITFQFLHAGFIHLLSNLWFLWIFGDNVEERLGRRRFLFFYLICGALGGLTQYIFEPHSKLPMIGASGSVAGVLGAYLIFFPHARIDALIPSFGFLIRTRISAPTMLGLWFIIQLFSGVASLGYPASVGGVAFLAHVGGFVAGYLWARRENRRDLWYY